ncbi:hypothetical protein DFH08DRAFT_824971 [Mycena albidolilacea]|uniref:Uncharacterized protein n=1 Tax=Mycena albidolilacea TaxID=1033008 RepID=A0AAD6Z3L9_9AGAR|nr:hypothetical protein DFH08DRAFT_824971 [Mycena albidolilacea]
MSGPSAVGCPMFCVFCMGCPMGLLAWDIPSAAGGTEKFVGCPMWPKKRAFLRAFLGGLGLGGVILEACVQGFQCTYLQTAIRGFEYYCQQKAGVAGGYSVQHGCARVVGGILCSTVALGLWAVFRAAQLRSGWGCRWYSMQHGCARVGVADSYSVQHGCARVAGSIPRSTVALGLWVAIPRSTVALGLRYSVRHGYTRVVGGIPRDTVALGLRVAILRRKVALGLRAVVAIPRRTVALGLRAIPHHKVALGLWAVVAIPRRKVALALQAIFCAARLRSHCGQYSTQHGCARIAGNCLRIIPWLLNLANGFSSVP